MKRSECVHITWKWRKGYRECLKCKKKEELDPCPTCKGYGGVKKGRCKRHKIDFHNMCPVCNKSDTSRTGYCEECLGYGYVVQY